MTRLSSSGWLEYQTTFFLLLLDRRILSLRNSTPA